MFEKILKANPYHGEDGRFSTKDKAKFVSTGPKFKRKKDPSVSGSGNGEIKDKNGVAYNVDHESFKDSEGNLRHRYTIVPKGAPRGVSAGGVDLTRDAKSAMSVSVHGEYRRKGLATALYKHIEQHLGYKLKPNKYQTEDGEAFWASRGKTKAKKSKLQSDLGL